MSYFPSRIWNSRLQLLWIAFTAVFILVGEFFTDRWVSSLLATIGALLIFILITQILHSDDISGARPTMLLAFTSMLVLGQESLKIYNDSLALVFCIIVATMLGLLAWVENKHASIYLRRLAFSVLILIVLLSFSQLFATMLIKHLIANNIIPTELYIIAPHALGMIIGFLLAFLFVNKFFQPDNGRLSGGLAFFYFFIFYVLAIWASYTFNNNRLGIISSDNNIVLFYVSAYVLTNLLLVSIFIKSYFIDKVGLLNRVPLGIECIMVAPMVLGSILTSITSIFYFVGNGSSYPVVYSLVIEWLVGFFLFIAVALGLKLIEMISRWAKDQEDIYNKTVQAD